MTTDKGDKPEQIVFIEEPVKTSNDKKISVMFYVRLLLLYLSPLFVVMLLDVYNDETLGKIKNVGIVAYFMIGLYYSQYLDNKKKMLKKKYGVK
ncbi:MAG: hypothetical protein PF569_10270 [Candidatus Woesearchaeota archaeon]|jgi:hypothetical protein|nr:hypothetical protein [Candidatus Woesearchaeota archaeon]